MRYASVDARTKSEAVEVLIQSQLTSPTIGHRSRGAAVEAIPPANRRERERLAVLEAQIAQTCYELSRLRGEHRRIAGRLALLQATGLDSPASPSDSE